MSFNPLNYPICFSKPERLTDVTSWHEHIPFAFTIMQMMKPKIFVELGTHKGDSYCAFCQAVNLLGLNTACYAVDTWEGDEHSGLYGSEIFTELKTYHDSRYKGFSQLIQSRFEEALDYFSDGSIDLIHIDGCHTYDAVKNDFEAWLPKMSPRSIVLFHDINVHEREFGVWKFWEGVTEHYPCFEFKHGHGLGVLAVGTEVPEEVLAFLNMGEQEVVATTRLYSYLGSKIAIDHQLQSKDAQIIELNNGLQARDVQITEITSTLQVRDTQVTELNDTLQARDAQITEITSVLQVRDTQITELNVTLQARDAQITELNGALQSKDGHILSLENEIHLMQQSIVWRLTMKFHNFFVERILPHGTQRRRAYDFGLKGCRILVNDGGKSLWWNYRNYKNSKINLHKYKINSQSLNVKTHTNSENIKPIEKKVSVVIPTKNGGPDFEYTLEKIRSQDGIKEIETIIIDSGSLDDTVKLAEKFDATVYCIKPEDFNHGETRNYGAEKATGDYILFMVQDAIPIGDHWLYNMVKVLENDDEIAAVTCRQVPRSDADLFACFSLWNHYKALNFFEDRISSPTKNFSLLSPLDKRKLAGLENVSCLIKRNIFNDLKFEKIQYAEDLELGLRILDNKFKIAFLYSVGIIHSHNRIPSYFLKRAYVDNKVLPKILSYDPVFFTDCDLNDVFNQITTLYAALNTSLKTLEALSFDGNYDIISKLKYLIEKNLNIDSFEQLEYSCNSLDELFIEIQKVLAPIEFKSNNLYVQSYFNLLDHLNNYIEKSNYNSMNTELIDSFYKLFAIVSGSAFANNYLFKSNNGEINENALIVDCILSEGL